MNKMPLFLLSVAAATLLASCSSGGSATSSSSKETTISSSESSEEPAPVVSSSDSSISSSEKVTSYSVTYNEDPDHPKTFVKFYDKNMGEYANGSKFKIGSMVYVEIDNGLDDGNANIDGGHANNVALSAQTAYLYSFQMPEEDVIITVDYVVEGETSVAHSITYTADPKHSSTSVTIAYSVDDIMNGKEIKSAKKGETVIVYPYSEETISAVYANKTKAIAEDYGGGVMIYKFEMPDEDVVITIEYSSESTAVNLTCADGLECTFYSSAEDAVNGMMGSPVTAITTANVGDSIVVYVFSDTDINHVYNGTGDNKTQLVGASTSEYADLSEYGIYALTVPSTGVYINID